VSSFEQTPVGYRPSKEGKHANEEKNMRKCHRSKCFLTSAASVLAGAICIVQLIVCVLQLLGASAIAQPQTPWLLAKDEMSWKDILGKAGPPVQSPSQEPADVPQQRGDAVGPNPLRVPPPDSGQAGSTARTQDEPPQKKGELRVVNVARDDALYIRHLPTENSKILGMIPPEATDIASLGKIEGNWISVRYGNTEGWVNKQFIAKENAPDTAAEIPAIPQEPTYTRAAAIPSGPSFDCKRPKSPNERLICESSELSELYQKMSTLYDDVGSLLNRNDREELTRHQRKWVRERIDCGDDFLCTKSAYVRRIDRLNSVLFKLQKPANAEQGGGQCNVLDPESPLNVRTTPNGSIVGSLSNGTGVVVLDYDADKTWAFVGRSEDRSPVGWVYTKYLDCRTSGTAQRAMAPRVIRYDCDLTRQFPDRRKRDKDPVVGTNVILTYDGGRFTGMDVYHQLESGVIHKRSEQYRDFKSTTYGFDDGGYWRWTGVLATNRAISMKGQLSVSGDEYDYTEQQTANGNLSWVAIWSCHERQVNSAN
jgi:uncharacterized protein